MKPWVIWLVQHRMGWLVKTLAVLLYPLILAGYCREAWGDVRLVFREVNRMGAK